MLERVLIALFSYNIAVNTIMDASTISGLHSGEKLRPYEEADL
jgi:hypothetical protein